MHFLSDKDRKRLLLFLSQMRMVCDSSYILDQKTRYDIKVDECVNIICDIISEEGEKVVVFSQWERMTRLIAKELEKKEIGFEYLHGGMPSEKRKNLVDNFMNEPSSRVFLSTDAGSTGLNLQSAATIINIDLPWIPAVLEQRIGRIYRLGQQNNIQVINLVTPDSIEEEMLGKLRFKTSMFEGGLDDGEDSVFITDDKLSKMMETVSDMVEEDEETNKACDEHKSEENKEEISIQQQTNSSSNRESVTNRSSHPKDLVVQGISFLSGLAETLKSPEATAHLVDSIVEKDEQTGETSIKIPVGSKETVSNLLNLIGKLFAK